MRRRSFQIVTMTGILALGACATPEPAKPTTTAAADPTKPATCGVRVLNGRIRPGEDMQLLLSVKPNSQWCFDGISLSNTQTEGQAIATAPSHGELRLVHQPGAVVFGYRPAPGFTGSDRFRISIPGTIESFYIAGNVTVGP